MVGSTFLPEEIRDVDGHVEVYSLEDEFSKTKKNKNYKLYFFIIIFISAILGFAYLFTDFVSRKDRDVPLDIKEFEDLRLKEVLQSTRFYENRIEMISMKIQSLRIEMLNEILDIRKNSLSNELDVIGNNLPQGERDTKLKEIRDAEGRKMRWTKARFRGRIAKERRALYALESQMRKERALIEEKKKQGLVTNEDKLNSLKMKNLRESRKSGMFDMQKYHDSYIRYQILKYNPIFRSPQLKSILSDNADASVQMPTLKKYHEMLKEKTGFAPERFNKLHSDIEKDFLLIERLKSIPNINSVAPSIRAIDSLNKKIIGEYEVLWGSLFSLVDAYHHAIQKHLEGSKVAQGIIIDARNEKSILTQLTDIKSVKVGTSATVIRGKEQKYIATIEFTSLDNAPRAKVVEKKESLKPFDEIVLVEVKELNK